MASRVAKNTHLLINAVNLSAFVVDHSFPVTKDSPEDTAMGDNSRSYLPDGLRDATITIEFNQDDAAGAVSATLWPIFIGSAAVAFQLNPDGSTTSTANPKYTGNCFITTFEPIGGTVGDAGRSSASFQVTGDVTRATA